MTQKQPEMMSVSTCLRHVRKCVCRRPRSASATVSAAGALPRGLAARRVGAKCDTTVPLTVENLPSDLTPAARADASRSTAGCPTRQVTHRAGQTSAALQSARTCRTRARAHDRDNCSDHNHNSNNQ